MKNKTYCLKNSFIVAHT